MSYLLNKPYTEKEKSDFIVKYNHNQGLKIEEIENGVYALEANEIMENGIPVINPNYEAEQEVIEQERINMLSLTSADVERAIYKAKSIDFEDIIELVKEVPSIDIKALKIELKANNFYRGNPYINTIGEILGFSSKQLDEFFDTNDYTKLV